MCVSVYLKILYLVAILARSPTFVRTRIFYYNEYLFQFVTVPYSLILAADVYMILSTAQPSQYNCTPHIHEYWESTPAVHSPTLLTQATVLNSDRLPFFCTKSSLAVRSCCSHWPCTQTNKSKLSLMPWTVNCNWKRSYYLMQQSNPTVLKETKQTQGCSAGISFFYNYNVSAPL